MKIEDDFGFNKLWKEHMTNEKDIDFDVLFERFILENDVSEEFEGEDEVNMSTDTLIHPGAVRLPISSKTREIVAQKVSHFVEPDTKELVGRNLLAVLVVLNYLRLQGYQPDLDSSDCWNPMLDCDGEVSDLFVSQVGRIECCAIAPEQNTCAVPIEGQFHRVAYLVVELDPNEKWGYLLGFVPGGDSETPTEELKRDQLSPIDELGDILHRLGLLWKILQDTPEPWEPDVREEMVALLERIYRTQSGFQRPMRAVAAIRGVDAVIGWRSQGEQDENKMLGNLVREVFKRLDAALKAR